MNALRTDDEREMTAAEARALDRISRAVYGRGLSPSDALNLLETVAAGLLAEYTATQDIPAHAAMLGKRVAAKAHAWIMSLRAGGVA